MKANFFTILVLSIFFSLSSYAQSVCRTQVLTYSGPENTSQLTTLLNTSTNPILANLNQIVKDHLIACTIFENGLPVGNDPNCGKIEDYMSVTQAELVLSTIFGVQVNIYSHETKPAYPVMSMATFMGLYNSNPTDYAFRTTISRCYNCYFRKNDTCCEVNGNGCYDFSTEIISSGLHYYIQN